MTKEINYTESCGNVFADLGLENAEELHAKSKLAVQILKIIKKRKLTQIKAAKILGTNQSQLSLLRSGDCLERFTFDRLMSWLTKLDQNITVTVKRKSRNQESAAIHVAV